MSPRAPVNFLKFPLSIILFISILFFALSPFSLIHSKAFAATYYVDATNGNDSNSALSPANPWKTIAKINASKFGPGDQILFKRGEIWREQLVVPSSGLPGNPIMFGAYGVGNMPKITGANLLSGWSLHKGSTFKTSAISVQPNQVFMDSERLTKGTGPDGLNDKEWFWSNNVLYFRNDTGNPGQVGKVIEASQRDYCIKGFMSNIVYRELHLKNANVWNFYAATWGGTNLDNITTDSVISEFAYGAGIRFEAVGHSLSGIVIKNCTAAYNGHDGIAVLTMSDDVMNVLVEGNTTHHNCSSKSVVFNAGVKLFGPTLSNATIQYNSSYSEGEGLTLEESGMGIWVDTCGSGIKVRYNRTYANNKDGIYIEKTSGAEVHYNVSYANKRAGVAVRTKVANNRIYNNTCYGNDVGIWVDQFDGPYRDGVVNNLFRNNISAGNATTALIAKRGGENDGAYGTGNAFDHNCFGGERQGFIGWGDNTLLSTYAQWETRYGSATHAVKSEPQFVNPSSANFQLGRNSPCIAAGTDVGLLTDMMGISIPRGKAPDIGAFESNERLLPPTNVRIQ